MNNNSVKLPIKTRKAIKAHLVSFTPSAARAQLINIRGYRLADGETIAERIARDHTTATGAFRAALLLVDAGAATTSQITKKVHCGHGVFKEKTVDGPIVFEDGSEL